MNRRSFLQRLGLAAAAAGITVAAPQIVEAEALAHSIVTADVAKAAEPFVVPEGYIVFDEQAGGFVQMTADGWKPFQFPAPEPSQPARRTLASLSDGELLRVLENSLRKMSQIGDDAFLPSLDPEVHWRWNQVRQTVIRGYAMRHDRATYLGRIIALPAVGDAVFVPDEPGYAEWRTVRDVFYRFANKGLEV